MTVPGSNLLAKALSIQGAQIVQWSRAIGREPNAVKQMLPVYADPVDVAGSFQPKNKAWAQSHGLDLAKDYALFYATEPLQSVQRGESGDKFTYGGAAYTAVGKEGDWFEQDGWNSVLLVKTGPFIA